MLSRNRETHAESGCWAVDARRSGPAKSRTGQWLSPRGLSGVEGVEDARRAWHRAEKRAGVQMPTGERRQIAASAPGRGCQQDGGGHAHVQALDKTPHGDSHAAACSAGKDRIDPPMLVAE